MNEQQLLLEEVLYLEHRRLFDLTKQHDVLFTQSSDPRIHMSKKAQDLLYPKAQNHGNKEPEYIPPIQIHLLLRYR